jgi:hypothetical protein
MNSSDRKPIRPTGPGLMAAALVCLLLLGTNALSYRSGSHAGVAQGLSQVHSANITAAQTTWDAGYTAGAAEAQGNFDAALRAVTQTCRLQREADTRFVAYWRAMAKEHLFPVTRNER